MGSKEEERVKDLPLCRRYSDRVRNTSRGQGFVVGCRCVRGVQWGACLGSES